MTRFKASQFIQNLTLLIATTIIAFFLLEITLLIWNWHSPSEERTPWSYASGRNKPMAQFDWDPHGAPIFVSGFKTYIQQNMPKHFVQYDRQGYRMNDRTSFKEPGIKIGIFGDSFTENLQVDESKTYAKTLARLLNDQKRNNRFFAFNFAVGKTGTYQEYLRYLTVKDSVKLDYVILAFLPINDVMNNHYQLGRHDTLWGPTYPVYHHGHVEEHRISKIAWMRAKLLGPLKQFYKWTLSHSHALTFIQRGWEKTQAALRANQSIHSTYSEGGKRKQWLGVYGDPPTQAWKEAWAITENYILRMKQTADQEGAEFVLLILTDNLQIDHPPNMDQLYDFQYPNLRLSAFCDAYGIRFINTYRQFMEKKVKLTFPYFSFSNDGHYSETGTGFVAEILFDYFNRWLLETPVRESPTMA